jgi:hypothetical protein
MVRVRKRKGQDRKTALAAHMKCLPPGGEDGQAWTGGEEMREVWSSREHPLAVVEEE